MTSLLVSASETAVGVAEFDGSAAITDVAEKQRIRKNNIENLVKCFMLFCLLFVEIYFVSRKSFQTI